MEQDRSLQLNGEELGAEDFNAATKLASRAQDFAYSELFRPTPFNSGLVSKAVIPFGYYGSNGSGTPKNAGIVQTTTSTNPSLLIYPFRALLGSRADVPDVSPRDWWRDCRAVLVASLLDGDPQAIGVNIAATVANNRVDLVYCKITIASVTQSQIRYVRDPSTGALSQSTLTVQTDDTYTIGVVSGTEATNPTAPSLPSDTATEFYIPLANVYLQHPTAGAVSKSNINEIAPVIPISRATGAATMQPGNSQWNPSMATLAGAPFTITSHRPEPYLPPTMTGMESRFFAFQWDHSPKTPAIGTAHIIDNTIDWRNRIFTWHVFAHGGGSEHFPWGGGGNPAGNVPTATPSLSVYGTAQLIGMGQSFKDDDPTSSLVASPAGFVARLTSSILTNISNPIYIYVDLSSGNLMVSAPVDPTACVYLQVNATGPFSNA